MNKQMQVTESNDLLYKGGMCLCVCNYVYTSSL